MPGRLFVLALCLFTSDWVIADTPAPESLGLAAPDRTRLAEPGTPVLGFQLTDQDGNAFDGQSLQGSTLLVFFGFTNCPNVCPPTLQRIRQLQLELGVEAPKLLAVFISVDGDRDTPTAVKQFLEPFGPGFIGLTGSPAYVRDLAARFSAVFFKGLPTDASGGYNVEHTSQTYLVDKDGVLRATFYNAPPGDMLRMTKSFL